ncbi:MAG: hypothetical protein NT011_13040 [Kiritimatiellaeota bacterium]|nr:hypothetical protein [Kiritimatiellota bacterium]
MQMTAFGFVRRACRIGAYAVATGMHAMILLSVQAGETGPAGTNQIKAVACDHRYGAVATWSHGTDSSQRNSFWWAEACAFEANLALTVFDTPFNEGAAIVPTAERAAAAKTGRLAFQIYFFSDSWADPVTKNMVLIPDYYATNWTQAGVAAGFDVKSGDPKPARFPNHGQQLYDISQGKFGYNIAKGAAGKTDVLGPLILYQREWVRTNFGHAATAGSYRNGQTGASYAMTNYLLGARNSGANGDTSYGKSSEGTGYLGGAGGPSNMTPRDAASLISTTRADDMDWICPGSNCTSRAKVLAHCGNLLQEAVRSRGWYRDFIHWHGCPRFEMTLEDFYRSQRAEMKGHDVVTLDFGTALQHKFLRDMATVQAQETETGVALSVTYRDPYGTLPLAIFHIPLSVRIETQGTRLAGKDIVAAEGCDIRRLEKDVYVVDVPFNGREETVTVHLAKAQGPANYLDFSLPVITSTAMAGEIIQVRTDRPTRVAVFSTAPGKGLRPVGAPVRSNDLKTSHALSIGPVSESEFYIGVISRTGQSILSGPVRFPGKARPASQPKGNRGRPSNSK